MCVYTHQVNYPIQDATAAQRRNLELMSLVERSSKHVVAPLRGQTLYNEYTW